MLDIIQYNFKLNPYSNSLFLFCGKQADQIKAFHYALSNHQEFFNYLKDGHCSISNSLAENCIWPFVIGRKNWLFAGSPKEAAASASIHTLVETTRANRLAPMKYIKYILADMLGSASLEHPEYLNDYLPWNCMVKELCQ